MSVRVEYAAATSISVEYTDERNLDAAEDPEARDVLLLGYDEVFCIVGGKQELLDLAARITAVVNAGAGAWVPPPVECDWCGIEIHQLNPADEFSWVAVVDGSSVCDVEDGVALGHRIRAS